MLVKDFQFCAMEKSSLSWREAFTFTRSELRGFRLLTLLLISVVCFRLVYFRWAVPAKTEFHIPSDWLLSDSLAGLSDSTWHGRENRRAAEANRVRNGKGRFVSGSGFDSVPRRSYEQPFKRSRMVELNGADTIELRGLPAIGPWLARKIVEYRERLGGFYSAEQLLEVYRLTPGKLDTIWPYLRVDTTLVRKVDINHIPVEDLFKHPYLSRSQAKGLCAYREKHGPFNSTSDLKKCLLIDDKTFEKMRNYIAVR